MKNSTVMIKRSKNLFIATLWPTFFCFMVGIQLHLLIGTPLIIGTFWVMFGEFVVVTLLGYPIFKIIMKNKKLVSILRFQ
ncbi:MAG: QueT transporter family protein [Oscillospiraceae bacterium]